MTVSRREAMVALTAGAVGAAAVWGTESAVADEAARAPLPTYGTAVSAVRPDTSRPAVERGTLVWSGPRPAISGTGGDAAGAGDVADQTHRPVRRLALTFDDGPHPDWTPRVLAALARHDVPATFFVRGDHLTTYPGVHRPGGPHEIANHTWDHPDLGRLAYPQVVDQLTRTSRAIETVCGRAPTYFRPPYGHLAGSTVLAAAEAGLQTVLWSAQMREGSVGSDPAAVVGLVRQQVAPGDIILAHDSGSADRIVTIDHLDAILAGLRADGYELVTLSQLLAPAPV